MPQEQTVNPIRTWPDVVPAYNRTLGWSALAWASDYLKQPDGPTAGEPWHYTPEQVRILLRWYEIDDEGKFLHRRGVLRRLKGWGKDPFLASIAAIELCGPCRFGGWSDAGEPTAIQHPSPWIQVAAVSRDQTRNTMTLFPGLFTEEAKTEYRIDLGKEIIYARGTGRLEAVTSSPRALEGGRPTLVIANETHHWLHNNDGKAMAEAIRRNLAKSRDGSARVMEITNAHLPGEGSVAEDTFEAWRKSDGQIAGVYYDSVEAPETPDLNDRVAVKAALIATRGDSFWLDVDRLADEIADPVTPETIARRFYLNQVTASGSTWLPDGAWESLVSPDRMIEDRQTVVLGFDGSRTLDSTALVAFSVEDVPHLEVIGLWERPLDQPDWTVPRAQVLDKIRETCKRFKVLSVAWDDYLWQSEGEELTDEGIPILRVPQSMSRMGPATQRFYEGAVSQGFTHAGDPRLDRHLANVYARTDSRGTRLVKESKSSARKIDLIVAAVMAFDELSTISAPAAPKIFSMGSLLT